MVNIKSEKAIGYCMVGVTVFLHFSSMEFGIRSGVRKREIEEGSHDLMSMGMIEESLKSAGAGECGKCI
jgi:hypothetical protein